MSEIIFISILSILFISILLAMAIVALNGVGIFFLFKKPPPNYKVYRRGKEIIVSDDIPSSYTKGCKNMSRAIGDSWRMYRHEQEEARLKGLGKWVEDKGDK